MIIKPRVILLGNEKVGKTTVYKQVTKGEFIQDYMPSISIDPGYRMI
jgi:GTPase SAR1 family protein